MTTTATFEQAMNILNDLGIGYQLVEHEPAVTTEIADKVIEGIDGVRTKTLFLTNRRKTSFYLVIMDDAERIDVDAFKEITGEKLIKMVSPETLQEKLGLTPGIVSPFGLLNDENREVKVFIDGDIVREERLSFHPNTNDKTIFLRTQDALKMLADMGYDVAIL